MRSSEYCLSWSEGWAGFGFVKKKKRTNLYYAHPYSAWERGSNENANGIIRRFFPKGTDFGLVSVAEIQKVEDWINNYPRRILGGICANAA